MKHRGFTLHELLLALTVAGGIAALASRAAVSQLNFFRGVGEIVEERTQAMQATEIVASYLPSLVPRDGDITFAADSAIEMRVSTGTAIVCASTPGSVTVPPARPVGNVFASFTSAPAPGDRVRALFADSLGVTWLTLHIAASSVSAACVLFGGSGETIALQEQLLVPLGTVLRFSRPLRISLYRASDNRFYLGARDWNASAQRFNAIQPIAGPLEPYSRNRDKSGCVFVYRSAAGDEVSDQASLADIASVTIVVRTATRRPVRGAGFERQGAAYRDSSIRMIAFRNRR